MTSPANLPDHMKPRCASCTIKPVDTEGDDCLSCVARAERKGKPAAPKVEAKPTKAESITAPLVTEPDEDTES